MIRFKTDKPVLVIGDVSLDHTVVGNLTGFSPDSPATVVRQTDTVTAPGGAANVALNLKAMGVRPILLAPVGADWAGEELEAALNRKYSHNRLPRYLVAGTTRKTTWRSSIKVDNRTLLRVDSESVPDSTKADAWREEILAVIRRADLLEQVGMIVYVDHGKGCVHKLMERLRPPLSKLPFAVLPCHRTNMEDRCRGAALMVTTHSKAGLPEQGVRPEATRYMLACHRTHAIDKVVLTDWPHELWGG